MSLLLENPEVKTHFFIPIKDVLVFNQALFIEFMEQKKYLNDSFTAYKNKIGLTIDGKFLTQRKQIQAIGNFLTYYRRIYCESRRCWYFYRCALKS
ncbi:site-specific DNA-methyltransferase [Flavobacterium flavigenum]|uniref:site-specific DNA-methyltransferase n=1 Tax=Flavobacterium flavigenum TaxID=3003258 RepID=UPI003D78D52D